MMNLIPPIAKRSVRIEYYIRLGSVYAMLCASALVLVVIMFIPVYVFISIQISSLSNLVTETQNSEITSSEALVEANQQASLLLQKTVQYQLSSIVSMLDAQQTPRILITDIRLQQLATPIVVISGTAETRADLVAFRDMVEMQLKPVNLELPIGNLVKEVDLQFSLSATLATTTNI
jgi:hypothetical protein